MTGTPYDDRPTHTAGRGASGKWHLVSGYGPGGDARSHCNSELRLKRTVPSEQVPPQHRCLRCGRKNSWPPYVERLLWIAWHPEGKPPAKNTLPYYGGLAANRTFYHGGGSTHMSLPSNAVVLKEYGHMSVEEADDRGIDDQFLEDFKPEVGSPKEVASLSSAWVTPDGDIYPCEYSEHRGLAKRICKRNNIGPEDGMDRAIFAEDEETLLANSWLRISPHTVSVNWDARGVPTSAQTRVVQSVRVAAYEHRKLYTEVYSGKRAGELEEACRIFLEQHAPLLRRDR